MNLPIIRLCALDDRDELRRLRDACETIGFFDLRRKVARVFPALGQPRAARRRRYASRLWRPGRWVTRWMHTPNRQMFFTKLLRW